MLIDFKGKSISVKGFDCKLGTLRAEPIAPFVNLLSRSQKGAMQGACFAVMQVLQTYTHRSTYQSCWI